MLVVDDDDVLDELAWAGEGREGRKKNKVSRSKKEVSRKIDPAKERRTRKGTGRQREDVRVYYYPLPRIV